MRNGRYILITSLMAWTLVGGLSQSGIACQMDQAFSQSEDTKDPKFRAKFDRAGNRPLECRIFIANAYINSSNELILTDRRPLTDRDPARIYADEGDAFEILIAAPVVVQMRSQGIKDPVSYFRNQVVRAKGKAICKEWMSFPPTTIRTLVIEKPNDIGLMKDTPQ